MTSVAGSHAGSASSGVPASPTSPDRLLSAARDQRLHHLRRLVHLKHQMESVMAAEMEHSRKAEVEASKEQRYVQQQSETCVTREALAAQAAERRRKAAQAAEEQAEAARVAYTKKLVAADERAEVFALDREAERTARTQAATLRATMRSEVANRSQMQEEAAILAHRKKQAAEDAEQAARRARREAEADNRKLLEAERAVARLKTLERARQELEARTLYFAAKQEKQEAASAVRQQQMEALTLERTQNSMMRTQNIHEKVATQKQVDAAVVERQDRRFAEKMARAEAMQQERDALMAEMQLLRKEMHRQESELRHQIEAMHHTGKWEIPAGLLGIEEELRLASASPESDPTLRRLRSRCMSSAERPSSARAGSSLPSTPSTASPRRPQSARKFNASSRRSFFDASSSCASTPKATRESEEQAPCGPHDDLLSRQELELRQVLLDEQRKETEREDVLQQVTSPEEHARLLRLFSSEREVAKRRILELSSGIV